MKVLKNKKGFTLIELLAVIVILAVLMMIAIPAMTDVIERARKDTYAATASSFVNQVRYMALQETYQLPSPNHYTIVATDLVKLESGGKTSSFGKAYDTNKSYVVIVNTGSDLEPSYKYYVAMSDTQGTGFNLTEETTVKESKGAVVTKGTGGASNASFTSASSGIGTSLSLGGKSYTFEKGYK